MMGIIIDDSDTCRLAHNLEATPCRLECTQSRSDVVKRNADMMCHGNGCQCVAGVVVAGQTQRNLAYRLAVQMQCEGRAAER